MTLTRKLKENLLNYLFIIPCSLLIGFVVLYPITQGLWISLHDWNIFGAEPNQFIGLGNYSYWFVGEGSDVFYSSLIKTGAYVAIVVPGDILLAIGFALVLNESLPARPFWRGLALVGYAAPAVVGGLIFYWMGSAESFGVLNFIFSNLGWWKGTSLLTTWPANHFVICLSKIWRDYGFAYVVALAAVEGVPKSLYEKAKLDGAGVLCRFRNITLPQIKGPLMVAAMIRVVFTVGMMATPWAITEGGPGYQTSYLGVLTYRIAYVDWNFGRAMAVGIVMAAILIPLILYWVSRQTRR